MKAAVRSSYDAPPVAADFREPEGDGEVLDVVVAGLNPVDLTISSGAFPGLEPELPSVAGVEGVALRDGAQFYFDTPVAPFGSMAERVLVDPGSLVPVPDGVDPALAVSFGIAGMAGWLSLTWRGRLEEGETVLVLGCSGVVGQIAVQAAKLLGAGRVVGAARNEGSLELAREQGADATVRLADKPGDDFAEQLSEAGDGGFDLIVDPIWGPTAIASMDALNTEGRLVQIGNSAAPTAEVPVRGLRAKIASIIGHTNFQASQELKAEAFERMCKHAVDGELSVQTEEIPLDDVEAAWARQKDAPRHKLVIRP